MRNWLIVFGQNNVIFETLREIQLCTSNAQKTFLETTDVKN